MKKTTPRSEYGFYCDLCGKKICKYALDFRLSGGVCIEVDKYFEICPECARAITVEWLEDKL